MKKLYKYTLALFFLLFMFSVAAPVLAKDGIVNFNTATAEEIMAIEYVDIPEELAKAIVEYRKANGPFKRVEDLLKVPGMTQDFFEEINPVMKDGDVVYDPDAEPMLAPSKC
ncbi:MAG: helix-hairpin-helix domain-containing protein [Deltaproteobacteria bacterium]|nr:helix-hairpin-helix domain-containing protein [Deltaproteobacteria bacterium]